MSKYSYTSSTSPTLSTGNDPSVRSEESKAWHWIVIVCASLCFILSLYSAWQQSAVPKIGLLLLGSLFWLLPLVISIVCLTATSRFNNGWAEFGVQFSGMLLVSVMVYFFYPDELKAFYKRTE